LLTSIQNDLARLFRAKSGRILAALVSQCRDFQLAEDSLQDALVQASEYWQKNAPPHNPEAWLLTVAKRRMIDRLRQSKIHANEPMLAAIVDNMQVEQLDAESEQTIPDERLKLIFTCCHPALNQHARVALTLKTLCGLSAREIARAYLVSETTMNQRLVRAKQKISKAGITYAVPKSEALAERLDSVLAVIYLIYNESYSAFEGQSLTREDLANEAIRLARVLSRLLPQPECSGLLALMLLHHSRSPARASETQSFIPLEHQDRTQWNHQQALEGRNILLAALAEGQAGKYQLQAAISALHSESPSWEDTDWEQILLLYLTLYEQEPSPVIKLNSLVALAQSGKAAEALKQLDSLSCELTNYQPFHAAVAYIQAKLNMNQLAEKSYQRAISLTKNSAEKDFLMRQFEKLSTNDGPQR
jgi:RNA polymerase sigma-70 factor (ECF subfamily)